MSISQEYQDALDAVGRAADQMTRLCDEYYLARAAARDAPSEPPGITVLRVRCEEASAAHDDIIYYKNNSSMGVQMAAAGAVAYRLAKEQGLGHEIPTEWFGSLIG
jgi:hypothetical protein